MAALVNNSLENLSPVRSFTSSPVGDRSTTGTPISADSQLSDHPMPAMDHYRRIQLARYLIDERLTTADRMNFNATGQICNFGVESARLEKVIDSGEPFRTSGCAGYDGQVACNRPFANSRPGPDMRNYPFPPTAEDVARIRAQMGAMPPCAA